MAHDASDLVNDKALRCRFGHLDGFARIYLAVSGGSDSAALMQLAAGWLACTTTDRDRVCVLTVNHGLREQSASEAQFVSGQAAALGLRHVTLDWAGEKPSTRIQEVARAARYRLMSQFAQKEGDADASVVVTAHTRDDQAETVLMRLGRGSGVDGLAAIPALTTMNGIAISRPLLDLSRQSLVDLLEARGVGWIADPSNDQTRFERIRLRQAKPERAALGLSDKALARTAARMARAQTALDAIVDRTIRREMADARYTDFGVFEWTERCRALEAEFAVRLLRRYVQVAAGQTTPPALGQIEAIHAQLQRPGFAGATVHGCRLTSFQADDGGRLVLVREAGREPLPRAAFTFAGPQLWDNRFLIEPVRPQKRCLTIGPLDGPAQRQLRQQDDITIRADLPPSALIVQPAVYDAHQLVAAPSLGWSAPGYECTSQFLVNNLFTKAGFVGP